MTITWKRLKMHSRALQTYRISICALTRVPDGSSVHSKLQKPWSTPQVFSDCVWLSLGRWMEQISTESLDGIFHVHLRHWRNDIGWWGDIYTYKSKCV